MKRREFLKVAGVGMAASAVAAPAIAQSMPEIKWRLAASWPKSLDTLYGACETLSKYVAEATDNKFQIQAFAAGEIVPGLQVARRGPKRHRRDGPHRHLLLYRQGSDLGAVLRRPVRPQHPPAERLVLRRRRHEADERVRQEVQCLSRSSAAIPARRWAAGFARRSRPSTISRASSSASAAGPARRCRSSASSPQQIAGGDIYPALEKGTIDAAEWVGPYDDEKLGFHKVAPYYYYPGWWEGGTAQHFLINMAKWNELPKNYQAVRHGCGRSCQC